LRENGAGDYGLFFIRDLAKREVDFLIAKGEKPVMLVEAKNRDLKISGFTLNLSNKLDGVPILQLVNTPNVLKKNQCQCLDYVSKPFFLSIPLIKS
jgi:hypothetical protein